MKTFVWIFAIMMTLFGCSKDAVLLSPEPFGDGYFQVKIGSKWNYRVDSFASPTNSIQRKYAWYVKDEVVDSFDNYNERHYIIERRKADSLSENFNYWYTYEYVVSASRLVRVVGIDTLTLMTWPVKVGDLWHNKTRTGWSRVSDYSDTLTQLNTFYFDTYEIEHDALYTFDRTNIYRMDMVRGAGMATSMFYRNYQNRFGSGWKYYNHWKLIDFEY